MVIGFLVIRDMVVFLIGGLTVLAYQVLWISFFCLAVALAYYIIKLIWW